MKKLSSILWGILLIVIGVIFGLNALEITDIDIFFKGWWTLIIIIPCFIGVLTDESKTGNLIGLVIGVVLLLCARDILSFSMVMKLVLPVLLIVIGCGIIFSSTVSSKVVKRVKELEENSKDINDYTATFTSEKVKYPKKVFNGATSAAIFGGVDMDLREAIIEDDIVINATAVFGGIDILVPQNVNVEVKSTAIFGSVNNKTPKIQGEGIHTVYIDGIAIFGGVEIKEQK